MTNHTRMAAAEALASENMMDFDKIIIVENDDVAN